MKTSRLPHQNSKNWEQCSWFFIFYNDMKKIIKKTKKFVGEHKELIIGVGMLTVVFLGGMYVIICTCE